MGASYCSRMNATYSIIQEEIESKQDIHTVEPFQIKSKYDINALIKGWVRIEAGRMINVDILSIILDYLLIESGIECRENMLTVNDNQTNALLRHGGCEHLVYGRYISLEFFKSINLKLSINSYKNKFFWDGSRIMQK